MGIAVVSIDQDTHRRQTLLAKIAANFGFEIVNLSRLGQLREMNVHTGFLTFSAEVDVILLAEEMY